MRAPKASVRELVHPRHQFEGRCLSCLAPLHSAPPPGLVSASCIFNQLNLPWAREVTSTPFLLALGLQGGGTLGREGIPRSAGTTEDGSETMERWRGGMNTSRWIVVGVLLAMLVVGGGACQEIPSLSLSSPLPTDTLTARKKVGVLLNVNSENDRSFNQYTLEGARRAAEASGLEFSYIVSATGFDFEEHIFGMAKQGIDLIMTVGFQMGPATAKAARVYPDKHFVTMDVAFYPGAGCEEHVQDCYTQEGRLTNVTSLIFAEDEMSYMAGVLAACMSKTGIIASVAGMEIPPVIRFVTGFQNGARSFRPDIVTLNQYTTTFDDPGMGKVVGQRFINEGADVIFGVGGNTGNGGLLAAHEAGIMAIGVDVDQYYTYPEVRSSLLTSAMKRVDLAAERAVTDFAAGRITAGIRLANLANDGVGLAPYHDWEDRVPPVCREAVERARAAVIADPTITGAKNH